MWQDTDLNRQSKDAIERTFRAFIGNGNCAVAILSRTHERRKVLGLMRVEVKSFGI